MDATTPAKITKEIILFCSEIDPTTKPIFIAVEPSASVRFNYCLTDVPCYAKKHGGRIQFGWIIWEIPKILLEAEFHTCWVNPDNCLFDISPKPGNESQILFLPDSKRIYRNQPVDNKRKPLVDNEYTRLLVLFGEKRFQIQKKHFKDNEVDSKAASAEFEKWLKSINNQK